MSENAMGTAQEMQQRANEQETQRRTQPTRDTSTRYPLLDGPEPDMRMVPIIGYAAAVALAKSGYEPVETESLAQTESCIADQAGALNILHDKLQLERQRLANQIGRLARHRAMLRRVLAKARALAKARREAMEIFESTDEPPDNAEQYARDMNEAIDNVYNILEAAGIQKGAKS